MPFAFDCVGLTLRMSSKLQLTNSKKQALQFVRLDALVRPKIEETNLLYCLRLHCLDSKPKS
jgi:hypothetical protein